MKRDLGRAGESKFVSWCSDVGITINKAEVDKHGWDFLLEFPVDRATGAAFDLHKSNKICKVQVKATEGKTLSRRVELSNLHALATDPLPVFYLFLHFGSGANPVDAYFLHLDDALIRRILKSAREHISVGDGARLHKKSLTLQYDKTHRLHEASGQGLLDFIKTNFYKRWDDLLGAKQEILRTAGFEDGAGTVNFTVAGEEGRESFILGSLGYENKIPVSDVYFWSKRFGIRDPEPIVAMTGATMTMKPTSFIDTKVMIASSVTETLTLPAKVYFSPLINNLNKAIFRISTEFIDVRADAGTGKMSMDSVIAGDKAYSLTLLRKVLLFFEKTTASRQDISFFFEHQGGFLRIFNAYSNPLDKPVERLSLVAEWLRDILKDSFDHSSVMVSPDWLRDNAAAIQEILGLRKGGGVFKMRFERAGDGDVFPPARAHFFHYRILSIDSTCYIFVFAAQCAMFCEGDGRYGYSGSFNLVKEVEGPNSDSWIDDVLNCEGERLANEFIEIGDLYSQELWSEISMPPVALMVREK